MNRAAGIAFLICAGVAGAQQQPVPAPAGGAAAASAGKPVQLDHVVAMIGTNVILQSDVQQEMHLAALEPLRVLPGQNTPQEALRRLIDRTLILEQMKQQQQPVTMTEPEVEKGVAELRKQIPECAKYDCETRGGWDAFLKANDLTPAMVEERWTQRMAILQFIDQRFQSGIRISQDQISGYYRTTLVPALAKEHEAAPPLAQVSGRIRELLLQQQVSGLFQDWLSSLRDQGNVQIVDQAYNQDLLKPGGAGGSDTGPGQ